jgi:hypothetical protein
VITQLVENLFFKNHNVDKKVVESTFGILALCINPQGL